MPAPSLLVREWQKDHVYLVQFPRVKCIPSISPFALKLETWLRMTNIPYTSISNEFTKMSSKGAIPFIELNGRQIADSNLIIEELVKHFHKEDVDGHLSPLDKAQVRMLHYLMEEGLRWTFVYSRAKDCSWFSNEQLGFGPSTGIKNRIIKHISGKIIFKKIKNLAQVQGTGRLTPEEMLETFTKDAEAASVFLGNKKFFFGDKPTTIDCTAFGHLAQLIYTPQYTNQIKIVLEEKYPNLAVYINRMKSNFWPDWEDLTNSLAMDTKATKA